MSSEDWRIEINAQDYFGHQKKKLELADRRPVIRRASDLVGPGIAATAVRVTDYNDLLATYNGYYASDVGALNAPNDTEAFVGAVSADAGLGGVQTLWGFTTGDSFTRAFTRNPMNPDEIHWGTWTPDRVGSTWYVVITPDNADGVPLDWAMNPFSGQMWRKSAANVWAAVFSAASTDYVDSAVDALPKTIRGSYSVPASGAGTTQSLSVSFPTGSFPSGTTPTVLTNPVVGNPLQYQSCAASPSSTGFTLNIGRGASGTASFPVTWTATA